MLISLTNIKRTAPGCDDISYWFYKYLSNYMCVVVSKLVNVVLSIEQDLGVMYKLHFKLVWKPVIGLLLVII